MLCFRLLNHDDPASSLVTAVRELASGTTSSFTYSVDPSSFRHVPKAPFAYWVSERVRKIFDELPALEGGERTVKQGLATADDFRFVRTAWEPPADHNDKQSNTWFPFAKGGSYSPFYADVFLKVNWGMSGAECKNYIIQRYPYLNGKAEFVAKNIEFYCRPGLTWPRRTQSGLALRAMPAGCVFADKGPAVILASNDTRDLLALLALTTSQAFRGLVEIQMAFGSYEVGVIQRTVLPRASEARLSDIALKAWSAKRLPDTATLTSHAFVSSAAIHPEKSLEEGIALCSARIDEAARALSAAQVEIDEITYRLYGFEAEDRNTIAEMLSKGLDPASEKPDEDDDASAEVSVDSLTIVSEVTDYFLGTTFGRWDIRYATGERQSPELPDPFDPLPVCPPGMLQNADGLPAEPKDVPTDYPLRISWPGILVDDENHTEDIVTRVRKAIEVIWKDRAEAIEQEACGILGVKTLRDYFRRHAAFFADHLKRYSKSRRQAPIYWPLSTKSGSYTLWLYYHRLTPDTLYKCSQQFVEPKMKEVEQTILRLRAMLTANEGGSKERKQLEEAEALLDELKEMHDELSLWAPKWKPNLNDGVLITACPLWKLFRLPKWRKDLETCWKELDRGDYDWAHLAYTLFPNRVREKCKTDRSIAIAHGLEDLCQVQAPALKKKTSKKTSRATAKTPAEVEPELLA